MREILACLARPCYNSSTGKKREAVRREQGPAWSSAFYMLARSLGLTALAAIPVWRHSVGILAAATGAMLLVQAVDGLVGIYLKKLFRAAGPFLMASIHGACLALLCLPHR